MVVLYDGKKIGTITTNRSLTMEEALGLINIDPNEMEDVNDRKYDWELFEFGNEE
jgi:hypothetical protein